MNRRRWTWLTLLLVVAAAAFVLLISNLPRLLESAIRSELAALCVSEFTLGEPYWGVTGAGTSGLRVRGAYQHWGFSVDIARLQADYRLRSLLEGDISALTLAGVEVRLEEGAPAEDGDRALDLAGLLNQLAALELPVGEITLRNLDVRYGGAGLGLRGTAGRLALDGRRKAITGTASVAVELGGEALPGMAVEAAAGALPWIPDLAVRVEGGEGPLLTAGARISPVAARGGADAADFPLAVDFTVDVPRQSVAGFAPWLPGGVSPAQLSDTVAALALAGRLSLPAQLDLQEKSVWLGLPGELAGDISLATVLPEQGVRELALSSAFSAAGTGGHLSVTLAEGVTFRAELDGEGLGVPAALLDDGDTLALKGSVAPAGPVVLVEGRPAQLALTVAATQVRPMARLSNLQVDGVLDVAWQGERVVVVATEPLQLRGAVDAAVAGDRAGMLGWPQDRAVAVALAAAPGFSLAVDVAAPALTLEAPLTLSLVLGPDGPAPPATLDTTVASLVYGKGQVALTHDSRLSLPLRGRVMPDLQVAGSIEGGAEGWRARLTAEVPELALDVGGGLEMGADGAWRGDGELRLANLRPATELLDALGLLPVDLAVAEGRATLDFVVAGGDAGVPSVQLAVTGENIAGLLEGVAFSGAQLSGELAIGERWQSTRPLEARIARLSPGVALADVQLSLDLLPSDGPAHSRWLLREFSADLFRGSLSLREAAPIEYPFVGNRLTILVSKLQLSDILQLYAEQGVSGEGVLNGVIPLVLEPDGVRVATGVISGEAPGGRLSFRSEDAGTMADMNEHLAMTLRVLEDFRYDGLDVSANFQPSGDLDLAVSLTGSNPGEFDGHPVHLNINLEENVFQLFRALRLTDQLTEKIQRGLEDRSPR